MSYSCLINILAYLAVYCVCVCVCRYTEINYCPKTQTLNTDGTKHKYSEVFFFNLHTKMLF